MMELGPKHIPTLAPGMAEVFYAGEKYTITDNEGKEFQIDCADRPWTLEFLKAFDEYMDAARVLGDASPHTQVLAKALNQKWLTMPPDLSKEMPSHKNRGIRLETTVHSH